MAQLDTVILMAGQKSLMCHRGTAWRCVSWSLL